MRYSHVFFYAMLCFFTLPLLAADNMLSIEDLKGLGLSSLLDLTVETPSAVTILY